MFSLGGLLNLFSLPLKLLWVTIQYFYGTVPFRKYKNDLISCYKMTFFIVFLTMNLGDYKYFPALGNYFIINKLLPGRFKIKKESLPNYGARYDANSIWLVKQPHRKPTDPIMIYIHGGAYLLQTVPTQPASIVAIYKLLDKQIQSKFSILFLDYKLTSKGFKIPHQMGQLHETYSKLVSEGNKSLFICGDSAGGNLAVGYTQYLDKVASEYILRPKSLILISPWLDMSPGNENWKPSRSYYQNDQYDMIKFRAFKGDSFKDSFDCEETVLLYSPAKDPIKKSDWDIECYTDSDHSVFLICGEDESFRDENLKWAEKVLDVSSYTSVRYGYSTGRFDPEIHHYRKNGDVNHCLAEVYVEPWGIHEASVLMETDILLTINSVEAEGGKLSFRDVSDEHFGIVRIAKFLNDVIE
ncbi:putative steryl acetyl hydrolase mug81 [Meyerozyma sp. JA9]|nr:putative steryl acetyl hydrolase mug81 [Meyerozyma sp. JA9]